VTVGNYAWLASHCIVLPGVTIGEGAVVAAGAVVATDVAPYTMVGGVPARYIKDRNRDLRYTLGYAKRFV
jgi:acetyltransferase-like isoleucine patch superfamily enzyme